MNDDLCTRCHHDHTVKSQEPDEVTPFRPGHSDTCDCPNDDACEQFILSENRYCDQPAVYHDEIRGQAYCEAHAAAWQKWRGAEDMTGMTELDRLTDGIGSRVGEPRPQYGRYPIERVSQTRLYNGADAIGWYVFDRDVDGNKVAKAGPFAYWVEARVARSRILRPQEGA